MQPTFSSGPEAYAGFWKRFLAYLIDKLILGTLTGILAIPVIAIGIAGAASPPEDPDSQWMLTGLMIGMILLLVAVAVVISWLYFAVMESSARQATLGKMAVGVIVVDMQGNRISFGRATARYIAKILSSLLLGIGFLMAGITQQKQALHDILAQCLVVNKT